MRATASVSEPDSPFAVRRAIQFLCEPGVIEAHVQPVVRPADQLIVGYEALARMPLDPVRSPDWWLARAEEVGLRSHLEIACLAAATDLGPTPDDRLLFVNLSPSLLAEPPRSICSTASPNGWWSSSPSRRRWRTTTNSGVTWPPGWPAGVRIAIDDAGAGYSSLRHVIELTPDFLKLDRELVRDLDRDRNRRALVSAMAAFAAEVGTSVIAEGVETPRSSRCSGTPRSTWSRAICWPDPGPPGRSGPTTPGRSTSVAGHPAAGPGRRPEARLAEALDRATDSPAGLRRRGRAPLPAGPDHAQRLPRTPRGAPVHAQRGLWQILDGMSGSSGITGRTWKTGRPIVVPDVVQEPGLSRGHPRRGVGDLRPDHRRDRTIGALNVESLTPLPTGMLGQLERCAGTAGRPAARHRRPPRGVVMGPHRPGVHRHLRVSPTPPDARPSAPCLRDASRMDSAALIVDGPDGPSVAAAVGPLGGALVDLTTSELSSLSSLVNDIRSCYTGGDAVGRGFVGSDSLRDGGARVVVVLPLWAQRVRLGSVVLAHSRPLQLDGEEVRPLETLADHVASALASSRHTELPHPARPVGPRVARRRGRSLASALGAPGRPSLRDRPSGSGPGRRSGRRD